jgi:predicted ester cyclase
MFPEGNKAIFRRHVDIWSTGDFSKINDVIDAHYVGHVAAGDRDRNGLRARIVAFRAMFPDVVFAIEDQMIDGDKVATRLTARGTHQTTGRHTVLTGINISRIVDGKIVEEWAVWETVSG